MPDPFWLCHECGAEMRPMTIDNTPKCASCNGGFIEILDPEVNPDPYHELPPPPPTRPGQRNAQPPMAHVFGLPPAPPSAAQQQRAPGTPSSGTHAAARNLNGGGRGGLDEMIAALGHIRGDNGPRDQTQPLRFPPSLPGEGNTTGSGSAGNARAPGTRTFEFDIGGGHGSVTFGNFATLFGQPTESEVGADPFRADPPGVGNRSPRQGSGAGDERMQQHADDIIQDLLRGLFGDQGLNGMAMPANVGDYAASEHDYLNILQTMMDAAGPQGPVAANETVIQGLPRFAYDEKKSQFKDCPVCKDDFQPETEVVKIPCAHIYHPDCLVPWLRQSGTCPVCRFSLVGEEDQQQRPPPPDTNGQPDDQERQPQTPGPDGPPNYVQSFFRRFLQGHHPPTTPGGTQTRPDTPQDQPRASSSASQDHPRANDLETASESSDDDAPVRVYAEHQSDLSDSDDLESERAQQAMSRLRLAERVRRETEERLERERQEREDQGYHPDVD